MIGRETSSEYDSSNGSPMNELMERYPAEVLQTVLKHRQCALSNRDVGQEHRWAPVRDLGAREFFSSDPGSPVQSVGRGALNYVLICTIGHSTRSTEELIGLLEEAGVGRLVDIRSVPRSRTNPQFNADALPEALAACGIQFTHLKALGGLRHHPKGAPPSPNRLWRNDAFRAFADYAMTEPFRAGLDQLCSLASEERCAIMCAEAVWWRCHRRIVADYLLARGVAVTHIMGPGKEELATLTPGAHNLPDGRILYGEPDLFDARTR
jgi:hypothetical protein